MHMQMVLPFRRMAEASKSMNPKVFAYINEGQIESFEGFEDFDLLAFDWYDIHSARTQTSKVLIYLDHEDLFFFCEDEPVEKQVNTIVGGLTEDAPMGNDQLLYRFFVHLLRGDMSVLDQLESSINDREEGILAGRDKDALRQIFRWRRELLRLKQYYEQLDSIFDELSADDNRLLDHATQKRMAILSGRMERYLGAVRNLQDMVSQLREAYQSQLSIQQNDLMKLFTVVTVIFLPLTLLVGWYGMNFIDMPELHWQYGYPAVIAASLLIVGFLIWFFKHRKWF